MIDRRDSLFGDIHREWLKPLGFRKQGRKSTKVIDDRCVLVVNLESYPATPGGPFRFSIELKVTWHTGGHKPVMYQLSLPSYATREQYWSIDEAAGTSGMIERAREMFLHIGLPSLHEMQSLEGLVRLFDRLPSHVSLVWYWQSYFELLVQLGRTDAAKALLCRVIEELQTREDIQGKAMELLASLEAQPRDAQPFAAADGYAAR